MISLIAFLTAAAFAQDVPPIQNLTVPKGFKVSLYAHPVPDARSLTLGTDGVVFVGNRSRGSVYALKPSGDGKAEVIEVASNLKNPNGIAFKDGDLYVAEINRIYVIKNVMKNLANVAKPVKWGPDFPSDAHHGWKYLAFGPDGWLYTAVGAPCNVCERDPEVYSAIFRISPDGKKREVVAQGVRNTVGFDWDPATKKMWFTENGRDYLGEDVPPDELNMVSKDKENFGFPYCHGNGIADPEFNKGQSCAKFTPPKLELPAHSANLGMRFIRTNKTLKGSVVIAQHGSWNRKVPIGYQVVRVPMTGEKAGKPEPLVTGFLKAGAAWGRPVDVLEMPDGSILISDDAAGAVYRVSEGN